MKKNIICKGFITLGLLLFFTLLLPFSTFNVPTAKASSVDSQEKPAYWLNVSRVALVKGKTFTLKVYNVGENAKFSLKSDDQEIASVTEDGVITAKQIGTTIITVNIKDSTGVIPLSCEVTVGPPAFSIKLTKSRIILGVDNSDLLRVILKPSNTVEEAKFISNDSSIVYVSPGGRIKGKKIGFTCVSAKIEATASDGQPKYSSCSVIVVKAEDVTNLETYFNDHPELNLIPEADLNKALAEFFNVKWDGTSTASMVDSLNNYLDEQFDLGKYLEQWRESLPKVQSDTTEVVLAKTMNKKVII